MLIREEFKITNIEDGGMEKLQKGKDSRLAGLTLRWSASQDLHTPKFQNQVSGSPSLQKKKAQKKQKKKQQLIHHT